MSIRAAAAAETPLASTIRGMEEHGWAFVVLIPMETASPAALSWVTRTVSGVAVTPDPTVRKQGLETPTAYLR